MRRASKLLFELPAGCTPASLPVRLRPHLAVLGEIPSEATGWVFEIKLDGYRMLARVDRDVRLFTRNGHDWTTKLPLLRAQIEALGLPPGWYDGELVACDEFGQPDFGRLQKLLAKREVTADLAYYLFDLPYLLEHDLRAVPLVERRLTLQAILASRPDAYIRFSSELKGEPAEVLEAACEMGLEGVMCKRADSSYADGRRSTAWRKLKCRQSADLIIGGYTGTRTLDKLLLGLPGADGLLIYAGSVGSGLSERARADLFRALELVTTAASPFTPARSPVYGKWVQPILAAEISFAEWTKIGRVRHPALRGVKVR